MKGGARFEDFFSLAVWTEYDVLKPAWLSTALKEYVFLMNGFHIAEEFTHPKNESIKRKKCDPHLGWFL